MNRYNSFLWSRKLLFLFSCSVLSDSLWHHGLQHIRLPCASPSPGACSNSCPLSQWCHPTISSPVVPFSSFNTPQYSSPQYSLKPQISSTLLSTSLSLDILCSPITYCSQYWNHYLLCHLLTTLNLFSCFYSFLFYFNLFSLIGG